MKEEGWTEWRQGDEEKRKEGDSCEVFGRRKESPSSDPHLLPPIYPPQAFLCSGATYGLEEWAAGA
ncbi:hypothetical protein EYF80_021551 [Liparis tanakae]|uniref:Uncharacterized protein n=1 Tax=Liparis tanakae TaxID=230148 RepID=A0A4Z2HQW0_9TELE|nr:hypothetical protein EYF80_021551 [Liparis tanakae]